MGGGGGGGGGGEGKISMVLCVWGGGGGGLHNVLDQEVSVVINLWHGQIRELRDTPAPPL